MSRLARVFGCCKRIGSVLQMPFTNNEYLLELVSDSQLKKKLPKALYNGTMEMPTYKFRRIPTLEELQQLTALMGSWSI